tara:strand:- start:1133 stop:2209 length:1077 start_codon:yes stop_codon:yes gene_type:complete
LEKYIRSKKKLRIFHLLPSHDLGGAEIASKTCEFIDNKNFTYKTFYISENKINKNDFLQIIKQIKNYLIALRFFLNQKDFILISSLWKSSLLSLLIKLFLPKTKVILFLHSTKSSHFFDKAFTSFLLIFAYEVWADSKNTLIKRFDELMFKRKFIKTKIVSFVLRRLKPVNYGENISFNFIYWGRLHKVKNLKKAIKFFNKFYCLDNSSKLTLIGHDYGMKNEIRKIIRNLKLTNNVKILKFMDMKDITEIVKDYSFFLQLSSYEGMAMAVVESMQLGLIPIVTNVGEIENYCIDLKNSIIYEGMQDTFEKVLKVKNNYKNCKEISNRAISTWNNKNLYHEDIFFLCQSLYDEREIYL